MSHSLDPRERDSILGDLDSTDDEVRRLAVERLTLLPSEESLPRLAAALGDESWRVRKAAVECLAGVPEDWPVAAMLLEALADGDDPGRRNAAVEALVRIGRRMVDPLLDASTSADVDVRKLVADALAGIGSERAVPRLVALLDDVDPNVRVAAADALGALGGEEAQRTLVAVALRESEESLVRFAALRGLARLEAPLGAAELGSALEDPMLRPVAFSALGRTPDPEAEEILCKGLESGSRVTREAAIEALLRIIGTADPNAAQVLACRIRAIARSTSTSVDDAVERLQAAELGTRLMLAQFLGIVGTPPVVKPLLAAARDDEALFEVALGALTAMGEAAEQVIGAQWPRLDGGLRILACEVLGRGAAPVGAQRLLSALEEPDPMLRAAAARALGRRRDGRAAAPLLRCLQRTGDDDEPEVEEEREALIQALEVVATDVAHGDVLELVLGAFEGAVEPVRLAIARVLGASADTGHGSMLALLVQDPSPAVRRAAVGACARMTGDERSETLRLALADESAAVRIAASAALAEADASALDDLERLVCDEDVEVRAAAVRAIAGLRARLADEIDPERSARVAEILGAALLDRGPVAIAAVWAFEQLAPGLSILPVRAVLDHPDPEVVQSAVACLCRHGPTEDLTALIPLLSHPDWAVRAAATEALAERRVQAAVPSVLRRLDGEADDFVRGALLRALERLEEA